jgi:hypothetical protein
MISQDPKPNVNLPQPTNKLWSSLTFFNNSIRTLTEIFKNTNVKVAYKVNNTIKFKCSSRKQNNKYNNSGVHQLKCGSCEQVYIGQTGRDFKTRFKEHVHDIRYNLTKSKYAEHILEHSPIDDIMNILRVAPKGKMLDILEKFHIYKSSKRKAIINEQNTKDSNILFYLALNRGK